MMTEIKIETARLVIRPFQEKDSAGYFDLYKAPTVHCFMPDKISTFAAARDIVFTKETQRATEMAVCLKDTDTFIGTLFGHWEDADTYSICWHFLATTVAKAMRQKLQQPLLIFSLKKCRPDESMPMWK